MAKEKKKKNKIVKIIILAAIFLLGIAAIVALVFLGSIYKYQKTAKELTASVTEDTFRQTETSVIYDINGDEITSLSGIKELYYLTDDEIPDMLKRTFVLIEDKDYYKHGGIDIKGIIRASIANARSSEIEQGASTITQQLARNIFLTQDVTWARKLTEMFVAMELEKKFTKTQILEFYINNIYYANGYYGIEAAAQGYFGKTAMDLSLSQMIFLAGIPNNPSKYDPVSHFDTALERRNFILKQLYADGQISALEYYQALEEDIVLVNNDDEGYDYVETYVFYCATRALMEANGFVFQTQFESEEAEAEYDEKYDEVYSSYQASLFTSGYRIYTSIDLDKQELLQQTVNDKLKDFTDVNEEGIYALQASAACIDNNTGYVTAIVGGRKQDYDGYTLNRAYQSYRQPGSAIKPVLVYAPYMMLGHNPDELIDDSPISGGPDNVNDEYLGEITLTEALGWSSNVCAWKLMESMTPAYGMSFLHLMNFNRIWMDENNQNVSIGGFTYGATAVEMASAYAALENDGVHRNPTCIEKITNSKGEPIIDNYENGQTVYDETAARMVTKMMEYGVNKGRLTGAKLDNAIVAAKSGTTNDNKDGWLVGYSRYYTTAVWVGNDMPSTVEGLYGGTYPLDIWKEYMHKIHEGLDIKQFPDYADESEEILSGTESENDREEETETHPGYNGGGTPDISDGDGNANVSGMGDQDVDVSGMGDQNAR